MCDCINKKYTTSVISRKEFQEALCCMLNQITEADTNSTYTFVDTDYSKAYLRHLFKVNEMLGKQIATMHNLGFYLWLMREARKRIIAGDFYSWKEQMVKNMDKRL